MHEASLVRNVLERVVGAASETGAAAVTVVRLRIGPDCHMTPDLLRSQLAAAAVGSVAAAAEIEIVAASQGGLVVESIDVEV